MTTRPWLPLAAVACTLVFWASAFVAIRHLGDDFSPGALSLGRLLVGSACLAVVALASGLPRPTAAEWRSIVLIGVLWFGIYNVALNEAERRVDAGTAAMLVNVGPILIALSAGALLLVTDRAAAVAARCRPKEASACPMALAISASAPPACRWRSRYSRHD